MKLSAVPRSMGKGARAPPPRKCCTVFLYCKCCQKSQYTKHLCIIFKCRQSQDPHLDFAPGPRWDTSVL